MSGDNVFLHPSNWSLFVEPLPPRFLLASSPRERIVSYAQLGDDYRAIGGLATWKLFESFFWGGRIFLGVFFNVLCFVVMFFFGGVLDGFFRGFFFLQFFFF